MGPSPPYSHSLGNHVSIPSIFCDRGCASGSRQKTLAVSRMISFGNLREPLELGPTRPLSRRGSNDGVASENGPQAYIRSLLSMAAARCSLPGPAPCMKTAGIATPVSRRGKKLMPYSNPTVLTMQMKIRPVVIYTAQSVLTMAVSRCSEVPLNDWHALSAEAATWLCHSLKWLQAFPAASHGLFHV